MDDVQTSDTPATSLDANRRLRATLIGFTAVLMWSLLALFTAASGSVPPFQLAAMCFLVGGSIGLARWIAVPSARASLRQPAVVWALADNEAACRFYKNAGGRKVARGSERFGDKTLAKIAFAFARG